jgi:hypothetical protein
MPRQIVGRRLFQADGYTFVRHIEPAEITELLNNDTIEVCYDLRADREIGYKLKSRGWISTNASLVPFGRVYNKDMHPPSINYPIPASIEPPIGRVLRFHVRSRGVVEEIYRGRGLRECAI